MTADTDFAPDGEVSDNGHYDGAPARPARRGRQPRVSQPSATPGLALSAESANRLAAELDTVADGLEGDNADRLTRDRAAFLRGVADAARTLHAS